MRLHRFFISQELTSGKEIRIEDPELIHQWKNVFRLSKGDKIILLDGSGNSFLSDLTLLAKNEAGVLVGKKEAVKNIPKRNIILFAALPKKDKFEWILEKGTELGISYFIPVVSERSEKKDLNMERSRKIIKEAAEQSERGALPTLYEPMTFDVAIEEAGKLGAMPSAGTVAFHLEGEIFSKEKYEAFKQLGVFIGPEGGWGDSELEKFKAAGIPLKSLGDQVLRAETAAVAVSALLLL